MGYILRDSSSLIGPAVQSGPGRASLLNKNMVQSDKRRALYWFCSLREVEQGGRACSQGAIRDSFQLIFSVTTFQFALIGLPPFVPFQRSVRSGGTRT